MTATVAVAGYVVTLAWSEYEHACYVGFRRSLRAVWNRRRDDRGKTRPHHDADVAGAVGELVVAKALGIFWPLGDALDRGSGDLIWRGRKLQVRTTHKPNGCLPLHASDPGEHFAVLVRGTFPRFEIAGAIRIADGRRHEFWRSDLDRPCFLVPAYALGPLR